MKYVLLIAGGIFLVLLIVVIVVLTRSKGSSSKPPTPSNITTVNVSLTGAQGYTDSFPTPYSEVTGTVETFINNIVTKLNGDPTFYWNTANLSWTPTGTGPTGTYAVKIADNLISDQTELSTLFSTPPSVLNLTGTILQEPQQTTYYECVPDPDANNVGQKCVPVANGATGPFTEPTCGNSCACDTGYVRGTDDNCYKTPFTHGGGDSNQPNCLYGFLTGGDKCGESPPGANPCNGNMQAVNEEGALCTNLAIFTGSKNSDGVYEQNPFVGGWTASCTNNEVAGDTECGCNCSLTNVPVGYMYCPYNSSTGSFVKCTSVGGCETSWPASVRSTDNIGCYDQSSWYCPMPSAITDNDIGIAWRNVVDYNNSGLQAPQTPCPKLGTNQHPNPF